MHYTSVSNLPIHIINFSDPSEKARHDRMVELVEQMLSLHQKLAEAKADHEETSLKRQINATDSQIDRLSYDLYQLTEEEIGIVENEQQFFRNETKISYRLLAVENNKEKA